jgi:hypothetical protein
MSAFFSSPSLVHFDRQTDRRDEDDDDDDAEGKLSSAQHHPIGRPILRV